MTKTKWSSKEIPKCTNGKNHKWKGSSETAICLKCGFDVFDNCYKKEGKMTKKNFIDFDIAKIIGIEEEEIDSSVNFYTPFCIILEDDNKKQVQLYLDYDRLLDLCHLLKPYLEEEESQNKLEAEFQKEANSNESKKNKSK